MPMPSSFRDREQAKFKQTQSGDTSTRVSPVDSGSLLEGFVFNDVQVTYPSGVIENYAYYLGASLVTTVEVTYTDASKKDLLRIRRIDA